MTPSPMAKYPLHVQRLDAFRSVKFSERPAVPNPLYTVGRFTFCIQKPPRELPNHKEEIPMFNPRTQLDPPVLNTLFRIASLANITPNNLITYLITTWTTELADGTCEDAFLEEYARSNPSRDRGHE